MTSSSTLTAKMKRSDYQLLPFKIDDVYLEFHLDSTDTTVKSKLTVRAEDDSRDMHLNGVNLKLISVKINGAQLIDSEYKLDRKEDGQQILTIFASTYASKTTDANGHYILEIENTCNPQENKTLQGLYFLDGMFSTQCESAGFRAITFFLDRPDNSSIYTTKIIATEKYKYLLSNGDKLEEGKLDNGLHYAIWKDIHPKPCYLFALVVGNFDKVQDTFVTKSGRKISLEIFVQEGKASQALFALEQLSKSFKWDEDRFDLEYDLDTFMVVAVPSFNMGAMENKGLNIFNDKYILGNKDVATDKTLFLIDAILAHEYFHNWTGNRVTCRDWFQLTLKEGLTVFRDQEYSGDHFDKVVNRISNVINVREIQFKEDASPSAHPIRPNEIMSTDNLYTSTVYIKGAEIIRIIHTLLGEEKFQKGMKLYFERHDGSAATCEDFSIAMQDASGIDLMTDFFKWYSQSGTPIVDVTGVYDADKKTYSLTAKQKTESTKDKAEKSALLIPLKTELYSKEGKRISLDNATTGFKGDTELLILKDDQATWLFNNVDSDPIIATNLDFSAPIILNTQNSSEDLAVLAVSCLNQFGKYDAMVALYHKYFADNIKRVKAGKAIEIDSSLLLAFKANLSIDLVSPEFAANILSVPSASGILSVLDERNINPLDLADIHKHLLVSLAKCNADLIVDVYNKLPKLDYAFNPEQYGIRQLKGVLIDYIARSGQNLDLIKTQYETAECLEDRLAALKSAMAVGVDFAPELIKQYFDMYSDNRLVLDYYLTALVTSDNSTLEDVIALDQMPGFSYENPNRIYASFLKLPINYSIFYSKDGSAVKFYTNLIKKVDKFNPSVASRLCEAYLNFEKLSPEFAQLIVDQLVDISKESGISANLQDPINNGLELAEKLNLI